jgi:hypothetical protein
MRLTSFGCVRDSRGKTRALIDNPLVVLKWLHMALERTALDSVQQRVRSDPRKPAMTTWPVVWQGERVLKAKSGLPSIVHSRLPGSTVAERSYSVGEGLSQGCPRLEGKALLQETSMNFTVGLKQKGKVNHVLVDAEDALIAALKAKTAQPEALIMYVRSQNRRGDARHPPLARAKDAR